MLGVIGGVRGWGRGYRRYKGMGEGFIGGIRGWGRGYRRYKGMGEGL